VRVNGRNLGGVVRVTFLGGRGARDDAVARARRVSAGSVQVWVPRRARTGHVLVRTREGLRSRPSRSVVAVRMPAPPPPPAPPAPLASPAPSPAPSAGGDPIPRGLAHVFPVRGAHDFGGSGARFGAGRAGHTHQGQDVMAACGTQLVAARAGVVEYRAFHASAGYYLVIDGDGEDQDYVYMHLSAPGLVQKGEHVATGQPIGAVGMTGNAQACHLHFELWVGGGWYSGGHPIDPLPQLRAWDAVS
jgi:murein DD-endopeptidase MepM/ murein hydrolase activator NlpD